MNPANDQILAATIIATKGNQVWFRSTSSGAVIRGFLPLGMDSNLTLDSPATVYLDAKHSTNGWWANDDEVGVNQRLCETGEGGEIATLTCQDECGRPWVSPVPEKLLEASEHCLTCNGTLAPA